MASPARFFFTPTFGCAAVVTGMLTLTGCQQWLGGSAEQNLPPSVGVQPLKGLAQNVSVRRNGLGMPLIESNTFHDALFAQGYVAASDRITQMVRLRLLAQGRLAELDGVEALDGDRLLRRINLKKNADQLYAAASPRLKRFFDVYARGVNAYLFRYRGKLPAQLAGYTPEYWKAEDSALMFALWSFSQSLNLQEELGSLVLAQKVGTDRLAWLLPVYPDESLPFSEADKLKGVSLGNSLTSPAGLATMNRELARLGAPSSSNWAIAPQRTRAGKSLFANDTHASTSVPSAWSFVQLRAPRFQAAGVALAGLPGVLAGFNGQVAWGMAAVMGDNQDVFLEKVRSEGGRVVYQSNGKWQPARVRQETYLAKGQRPLREAVYETGHGPLLNDVSGMPASGGYGLALQLPDLTDDKSLDALFDLSRASNVEKASDASRQIRAVATNLLFADASSIGWQVTGRFPNRLEGKGMLPSPGWDGRHDWDGLADPMLHPYDQDPPQGWLGTANQRIVPPGYGIQLSNAWYYPERSERLAELAGAGKHDTRSMIAMQSDQTTPFAAKLKKMFLAPGMAQPLKSAIDALPEGDRTKAREAYTRLMAFDGRLAAQSADAALYELFLQQSAQRTFLDELGPLDSASWKAFVAQGMTSYSAQADHLLGRDDSPFWDDLSTAQKEDKPAILARSLAAAVSAGEAQLGSDRSTWQWGRLHRTTWTDTGGPGAGAPVLRGPVATGGDHTTLNAAPYRWGDSFDTASIPALRIVVDFAQAEPMIGLGSSGQSGNPASANYTDGIDAWLKGQYVSFPMQPQHFDKAYGTKRLTLTPQK
ncbi:penicillin acylase family protein [Pseudomonas sp. CFBP 13710]|uniref:penicillin acylase family protein n=1 Tax=Pseudomonas sp. CFBP 13710 TaxID=2775311 RepID=UPI001785580E|nr:penicillin acylase family protein [Pseudomonas sp. CFBP 13710]MBD8733491.1 penicillin acylase family protein [Pseudomonas sp. CFBP 13710]